MKNVLIVDDEETLILIIETRFEDYKDQFRVLTASNGIARAVIVQADPPFIARDQIAHVCSCAAHGAAGGVIQQDSFLAAEGGGSIYVNTDIVALN